MASLAQTLEASLTGANAHTRSIFSSKPLTSRQITGLLKKHGVVALGTVKPSGRPHLSLTGMVAVKGRFYLGEARAYAALRNLERDPHVAVAVMSGGWGTHALIEGEAKVLAAKDSRHKAIRQEEKARFGWSYPVHVELVPTKVFTWAG